MNSRQFFDTHVAGATRCIVDCWEDWGFNVGVLNEAPGWNDDVNETWTVINDVNLIFAHTFETFVLRLVNDWYIFDAVINDVEVNRWNIASTNSHKMNWFESSVFEPISKFIQPS